MVFTQDWLPASLLAQRTPFCLAGSAGAELLPALDVDLAAGDVLFRKPSDDSFCDADGEPEARTGCTRLVDALSALGHPPERTRLTFVGQRFERCVLKTVLHAQTLGYRRCTLVEQATYAKEAEPDPEWSVLTAATSTTQSWLSEVIHARKSAGARLAREYLLAAGVRLEKTL